MHIRPERVDYERLRHIAYSQLTLTDYQPILDYAAQSEIIMAYWTDRELLAIAGFIPLSLLSRTAYLWMQSTPTVGRYKIATGRWAALTLREVRRSYDKIVGHCLADSRSVKWLESMGATFTLPNGDNTVQFVIGD